MTTRSANQLSILGTVLPRGASATESALQVSKVQSAYEQVADQLRQLILNGQLSPGDRLPVEGDLCSIFGVSRSTIREALRVLTAQDLVHTTRGASGGTFVSRTDPSKVSSYLETSIGLMSGTESMTVGEILEARDVIEVAAIRLACARVTPEHLAAMQETLNREVASIGRGPKFREHRNFHGIVVAASGNGLLQIMNEPVFRVLQARFLRPNIPVSFWRKVDEDHRHIIDRITEGDPDAAAGLMHSHLQRLRPAYTQAEGVGSN